MKIPKEEGPYLGAVSVVRSPEELTQLAVEFGGTSNFQAPLVGSAPPVQILGRRPSRYKAVISVDSFGAGGATAVMLAYRQDYLANAANPQGFIIGAVPKILQWENQQPCYAVAIGGGPVTISVIDQAESAAQASAEEAIQSTDIDEENELEGGMNYGSQYASEGNRY